MISHHHKVVFIHIPKCAGQSVEHMFLDDLGLTWETRAGLLLRPNDDPVLGPPRLAHLLGTDYIERGHISPDEFERYFKFALVRDPYDRALSLYNYLRLPRSRSIIEKILKRTGLFTSVLGDDFLSLDQFIHEYLPQMFASDDGCGVGDGHQSNFWFVRPQVDYICNAAGARVVDTVVRLEELSERADDLRSRCGLHAQLKHVNKSKPKATREALKSEHLDVIERLYQNDFEGLGYRYRSRS